MTTALAHTISELKIKTAQIYSSDESLFRFFPSISAPFLVHPVRESPAIGGHEIECLSLPLIAKEVQFQAVHVCNCHSLPIKTKKSTNCAISNRHVSHPPPHAALGDYPVHTTLECPDSPKLQSLCRVDSSSVSESILFGVTKLL